MDLTKLLNLTTLVFAISKQSTYLLSNGDTYKTSDNKIYNIGS